MKIRIDTVKLKKEADNLLECSKKIYDSRNKLVNIVAPIGHSIWIGADANKFAAVMGNYFSNINELSDCINDYSNDLRNICDDYDKFDNAFSSRAINV